MISVLGLDVSTKTGWAIATPSATVGWGKVHIPAKIYPRYARWARYENAFSAILDSLSGPVCAVIEGYSHGSRFGQAVMVEIGYTFRRALWVRGIPFVEVQPSTLKQYATGYGAAQKPAMVAAVKNHWGISVQDHDIADAYVAARFGLAVLGLVEPATGNRQKAVLKYCQNHAEDLDWLRQSLGKAK